MRVADVRQDISAVDRLYNYCQNYLDHYTVLGIFVLALCACVAFSHFNLVCILTLVAFHTAVGNDQ